jgi:hypothetical protein
MKGMQIADQFGNELVAGYLPTGGPRVSTERVNVNVVKTQEEVSRLENHQPFETEARLNII